ncbi:MAG: hypothetical protein IT443_12020 [Phycisphaeraceae bacterium]|nr:hypothetical protein [Phycisphaeraceae bacterium]
MADDGWNEELLEWTGELKAHLVKMGIKPEDVPERHREASWMYNAAKEADEAAEEIVAECFPEFDWDGFEERQRKTWEQEVKAVLVGLGYDANKIPVHPMHDLYEQHILGKLTTEEAARMVAQEELIDE